MDLYFLNYDELVEALQAYKWRVMFRGEEVKDETGAYAVFTEQAASASSIAAAKILDTISRLLGNNVEHSDGEKAYTRTHLSDMSKLLGLPRDRRRLQLRVSDVPPPPGCWTGARRAARRPRATAPRAPLRVRSGKRPRRI